MFKVGQLVWCKRENRYSVTDYHVKCKVVRVSDESRDINVQVLDVQVLEGFYKGDVYPVYGGDFEPVYKKAVIV